MLSKNFTQSLSPELEVWVVQRPKLLVLLYCNILYSIVFSALYNTILYLTVWYCIVLCCKVIYYFVSNCNVCYYITLQCTILYFIILFYTLLYYTAMYYTIAEARWRGAQHPKLLVKYIIVYLITLQYNKINKI